MYDRVTRPTSLLSDLRAATSPDHVALERLLGLPESVAAHVDRLAKFYGFYAVWEPHVMARMGALRSSLDGRRKLPLLETDLLRLGVTADRLRSLPVCDAVPEIDEPAEALGSMYVMEGSTLGGQIISRHLETRLGMRGGEGYSYYQSYGVDVGRMWKAFLETMQSHIEPQEQERLIGAATQTFRCLHRWFSKD